MDHGVTIVNLYYDPHENIIIHEDGRVLHDISHLIPHKDLMYLKKVGGTVYIESDEDGVTYELVAPIPEEVDILTFYYDKERNVMMDSDGFVMFNIFAYVRPTDLLMFKLKKDDMRVCGRDGDMVELIYPEES